MQVLERIGNEGLVPVVVIDDAADAADAAKALKDGGLDVMEITMRTAAGIQAIKNARLAQPSMLIGAGTILTLDKAKEAVDAGAEFIVSPGFNDAVVDWCLKNDIAVTPGCVTPTEIEHAMAYGLKVLKFFPANVDGGLNGMKAPNGPYRDISFIPTGGVSEGNLAEYADKPFIHAIGGGWLCGGADIKAKNFAGISKTATASVEILLGFELAHIGVNCDAGDESERTARLFEKAFGFAFKPGASSNFAGGGFEIMKERGLGEMGHAAIRTNSIPRAVHHLKKRGFEVEPGTAKEKNGKTVAVYLKESFGGFAVHLLQK